MTPPSDASAAHSSANARMGFIWFICLVASLGGLLFGYDWVVIGGAKPFHQMAFGGDKRQDARGDRTGIDE